MMKKSILVVDDESDLCELISIILKKDGFEVDCAYTLAEATEKLHRQPDFVLLDNNLPDGSGLEFIHVHPIDFKNCHVVMISADPSKKLEDLAEYEGIAFLPKPFSIVRIKEILKKVA